ncbi:MAG: hypothetical protein JO261_04715, partial [Alphaproteobacteria bacterium]|nr:hypothetical protein [Alphaproteobacteria bacterium]
AASSDCAIIIAVRRDSAMRLCAAVLTMDSYIAAKVIEMIAAPTIASIRTEPDSFD